ncbi:MAG: peptide chain release factor 2 [Alphaproteobacteria bacterium]|nr:peptide chain release factor 2 [Alphaproteobacteria bacterium]
MRNDVSALKDKIEASQAVLRRCLDWDNLLVRLGELNTKAEDPNLWNDSKNAQAVMRERTRTEHLVSTFNRMEAGKNDALEMIALAEVEDDQSLVKESIQQLEKIAADIAQLELESLLSGEADANDCFIEIHPGAGGTESQDWAFMLFRMYIRWGERRGFKVEIVDELAGEEAGIKSATIKLTGLNAYGWSKTESGVHRLVRISPFDSNARRHTSFASVWVYPVIDDSIQIEIKEEDLNIETMRSGGAGGQHVNKTESAVRITHVPTGIVVKCQAGRSQHANRAEAYNMLRARLYERELQIREAAANALNASKTDNAWGHQIRSYVLHPYQMVKDLRTEVETSDTQGVLDGDIDRFINASLMNRLKGQTERS